MRRPVVILLVLLGLNEILSGIRHMPIPGFSLLTTEFDWVHAISASVFAILFTIHAWFNRKAIIHYFRNLRYWWVLVGLGAAFVTWAGIVSPILTILGKV